MASLVLLYRQHYPGLVTYHGRHVLAYSFNNYYIAEDDAYPNKAERVKTEFWTYFKCEEGFEVRATEVLIKSCKKLVTSMHYDVKTRATITYYGVKLGQVIKPEDARKVMLTRDQYLQVSPWWCNGHEEAWARIVDRWFTPEYLETHNAARERSLLMEGPSHHQGSRSLAAYKQTWLAAHPGHDCNDFQSYCMAHKGKVTSNVSFNIDDPLEAYNNPSIHTKISEYTSTASSVHGPDYDPSTQDFDPNLIMRLGGRKKHGWLYMGDGIIDNSELSL